MPPLPRASAERNGACPKARDWPPGSLESRATKALALLPVALALVACTTLAPNAESTRIARSTAAVAACHPVGPVRSAPSYVMPGDDYRQLRSQTAALGGNAVLVTAPRLISTAGVAYHCAS